jgi:hypothetical protein
MIAAKSVRPDHRHPLISGMPPRLDGSASPRVIGHALRSAESEYRLTRLTDRFAALPHAVYDSIHCVNALVHYEASIA